mgnify:CR=1 FL=1
METIDEILTAMLEAAGAPGLRSAYAKILAPNDNSKNQVYLGGGFGALNIIPHGDITRENGAQGGAVRERSYAYIDLRWIDGQGAHVAPNAKLILYPRYPEVRLSGFLLGCRPSPSDLMGVGVRTPGRVLFLGVSGDGRIFGLAVGHDHPVAAEVEAIDTPLIGVFTDLSGLIPGRTDPVTVIREAVRAIADIGWMPSVKLDENGNPQPYAAQNGGGYTLEASLGVRPNGRAEPDYEGWEIKQYSVRDFTRFAAKNPVTLMTPEPDGGLYHDDLPRFIAEHGYPDQNGVPDRMNFGGIYKVGGDQHRLTGLRLDLEGFEHRTGRFDPNGKVRLVTANGEARATWAYQKLLEHWSRKHARAAYIPSSKQGRPPEYRFSDNATLFIGTDFIRLLSAIHEGLVYLDPALKAKIVDGAVVGGIHRRCQFRIRHKDLPKLYERQIV